VARTGTFVQNSSQSGRLAGKFPGKWDEKSSRIETIRFPVLGQVAPSTMGNSTSAQTVRQALKDLLKANGIGLKKEMVENFLKAVDQVASWFPVTGHLSMPSWKKLGKDLRFAKEQGVLPKGVMPVWKLVKNCIGDEERYGAELQKGNEALNQVREERSQKSETEGNSTEGEMSKDNLESITDSLEKVKLKVEPLAPGPPHLPPYALGGAEGRSLHPEVWRVFGITAVIVTAIAVSAAAAIAVATSLTSVVQIAAAVSNLSTGVAEALDVQGNINSQLKAGILLLYKRVNLLQEQADIMMV